MNATTQDLIIEADSLISVLLDSTASPHSIDDETSRHGITLILIEVRERLNSALLLAGFLRQKQDVSYLQKCGIFMEVRHSSNLN